MSDTFASQVRTQVFCCRCKTGFHKDNETVGNYTSGSWEWGMTESPVASRTRSPGRVVTGCEPVKLPKAGRIRQPGRSQKQGRVIRCRAGPWIRKDGWMCPQIKNGDDVPGAGSESGSRNGASDVSSFCVRDVADKSSLFCSGVAYSSSSCVSGSSDTSSFTQCPGG